MNNIELEEKVKFVYEDLQAAVSPATFKKAMNIFEGGGVRDVEFRRDGALAKVQGSRLYNVFVGYKDVFDADCDCYAGEKGYICKHVLALGLYMLDKTGKLRESSSPATLAEAKPMINRALRKIRPYNGPSSIWFSYTNDLAAGSLMLEKAVSDLPTGKEEARYLWKLVLRISKKLCCGGVDDSDGAVGNAVLAIVEKIADMAREDPEICELAMTFTNDDTGFGFEDDLRERLTQNFLST